MAKQPPVVNFSQSSDELERRDQPATEEDLQILKRADEILSSPAVWNRHDTRACKPEDKTWSLFCAMDKASLDVLGEYHHREVALQEVRFAVEDVTKESHSSVACYCRHIASDNIEIRLMVDDVVVYRQAFASIDAASEFAITKMHAYDTPFY